MFLDCLPQCPSEELIKKFKVLQWSETDKMNSAAEA